MWRRELSRTTSASREQLWRALVDLLRQPEWDVAVEQIEFRGDFANGARGRLKPRGAPWGSFELAEIESNRAYAKVQRLPMARMRFFHLLETVEDGSTKVTFSCDIEGPLSFLFAALFGRSIEQGQAGALERLIETVESQSPQRQDQGEGRR